MGDKDALKRELYTLIIVLIMFELSYLVRCISIILRETEKADEQSFSKHVFDDISFYFEIGSFTTVFYFHYKNFKPQSSRSIELEGGF